VLVPVPPESWFVVQQCLLR